MSGGRTMDAPTPMTMADLERFAAETWPDDERERRLFLARARAKVRDWAQKHGEPEAEVSAGVVFIRRPDALLPWELTAMIARGQWLARKYGWKDVKP